MINPFTEDLSKLSDTELDQKISELTKKYYQIARLGNNDLLTQVQNFITIYRDELQTRTIKRRLSDNNDDDLDQLINVD